MVSEQAVRPSGAKARVLSGLNGTAEQLAEKVHSVPQSAAKADTENTPVIAAVNRCATQNQVQRRVFLQLVKPCPTQNHL
jgi:hypothetical protein